MQKTFLININEWKIKNVAHKYVAQREEESAREGVAAAMFSYQMSWHASRNITTFYKKKKLDYSNTRRIKTCANEAALPF